LYRTFSMLKNDPVEQNVEEKSLDLVAWI
jgi:hypothetical protein